jgi:ubiquinone/menaquinone biosynthesis C-methylase UbiE
MGTERYVIRGGAEGRERLRLLAQLFGPSTRALIARVGVASGAVCLDVGCGGGDVTLELARAVGPSGRVIGVDFDAEKIDIARREAEQHGLRNVTFELRDVSTWEPVVPFDVVFARFLLTHVPDPATLLAALYRHVRPGGVAALEDIDFRGHFYEPHCPALDRFVELYTTAVRRRGGDAEIGPKLPKLLRDAGFEDVQLGLVQHTAFVGGSKLITCLTMEYIADAVVADGLASQADVQQTIEELYAFADDPRTVHGGPRVFQAWGRRGA